MAGPAPISGASLPEDSDDFDTALDMAAMGATLDSFVVGRFANTTDRNTAIPSITDGRVASLGDILQKGRGGLWRNMQEDTRIGARCRTLVFAVPADSSSHVVDSGWNSLENSGGFFGGGGTATPLTVPTGWGGMYNVMVRVKWAVAMASGSVQIRGLPTNVAPDNLIHSANVSGSLYNGISALLPFDDATSPQIYVQGAGSATNLDIYFSMYRVSA